MEKEIKLGILINSEGPLLSIKALETGDLFLEAYSLKYQGDLSFKPKFKDFIAFIESKITLSELIELSRSIMFSFNVGVEMKKIPLKDVIDSLPYIDSYYNEIPESLK